MILAKIFTIARYTFKQILKSKVFFITFAVGLALALVTFIATEFTYGVPEKISLDFGLGMLSLSSLGISLFIGATLLPEELNSRTVYMVISRPVPRWVFILGKISGLLGVLFVNFAMLSAMTLASTYLMGGEINQLILTAIVFNYLECVLLLLVVVFFSLFSNPLLSSVIALTLLVSGHAIRETQEITFVQLRPGLKLLLDLYHLFLPGFYKLNLKDFVIYKQSLEASYILQAFTYGISYSLFLIFLIVFIFNRKNLD